MAETKTKQVNVNFENDPELLEALDEMVEHDDSDRSKFIRKLIREEKTRRQPSSLTPTTTNASTASQKTRLSAQRVKSLAA